MKEERSKTDFFADDKALTLLEKLADYMPGGMFMYKADGDERLVFFNKKMVEYLGCDSGEDFIEYTSGSFRGIVHPDDLERVEREIEKQIEKNSDAFDFVRYRIIRKDGEIRWVSDYGHLVHSAAYGDVYYVFVADDTEARLLDAAEKAANIIAEERKKFAEIVNPYRKDEKASVGALIGMSVLLVSDSVPIRRAYREILKGSGAEVTESAPGEAALTALMQGGAFDAVVIDAAVSKTSAPETIKKLHTAMFADAVSVPIIAVCENEGERFVECIRAGADKCVGRQFSGAMIAGLVLSCMRERTEKLKKKLADAIRLANTDSLTHVKNVTAYTDKVAELTGEIAAGADISFAIVMCDVNGLKTVNDTQGHEMGDVYIKNCCRILCDVYAHSPVYRIGGDEFTAVLRGIDYDRRDELLKDFHERVRKAEMIETVTEGRASIAGGMGVFDPGVDRTVADVMKKADAAMYNLKRRTV